MSGTETPTCIDAPWWLVDNPQAVGAAAPLLLPEEIPWVPTLVPDTTPEAGPLIQYPGQGAVQLWDDVWGYGKSIVKYFGRHDGGTSFVLSTTLDEAIDAAIGSTVKSLSGFINIAHQLALDAQSWASAQFDAMSANIGAIYQYFDTRVSALEGQMKAVLDLALPSLQAQILQLRHDMGLSFQFNSAADRAWAIDNIYRPLQENIGQVAKEIPVWSAGALADAKAYTGIAVGALGVKVLTEIAPLSKAVTALQTESEQCTQPMCDTFGPKTDLGKLLKGLKVAEFVTLLAEIAAARETDLDGALRFLSDRAAGYVNTFESTFVNAGDTIGATVGALLA